ncbi:MAG: hypothetical protein ABSB30_07690 [Terracidiphilus sp.]|jgi:hypothetical protein
MEASEITRLQLQQSIETYRVQLSLLVQIHTILIVGDATFIGYAITQRLAGVIWFGLVFPVAMILMSRQIHRLTIPILATAVWIESRYADSDVGGLVSTFLSTVVSPSLLEYIRAADLPDDKAERERLLAALYHKPFSFGGKTRMSKILLFITVLQVVAPVLLWRLADWGLLASGPLARSACQ